MLTMGGLEAYRAQRDHKHAWTLLVEHYDWCEICGATRVHPHEENDDHAE